MEYKKGSFIQVGSGTFTSRFQAIRVIADATLTSLVDSTDRESNLSRYISDSGRLPVKAGAIIAARDGAFFKSVAISGGTVEIIF
jgi:hypothetical protein